MNTLKYTLLSLLLSVGVCDAQDKTEAIDPPRKLGSNIISAIPLSVGSAGFLFGISYERFLDKDARCSVFLPVAYNQHGAQYHYYDYYDEKNLSVFLGLKIYTTRSSSPVRHAIGLMVGGFNSMRHITGSQYHGGITEDKDKYVNYPLTGMMVHNSLNVSFSKHISYTWEVDLGMGSQSQERDENDQSSSPMLLTQMTLGYRF